MRQSTFTPFWVAISINCASLLLARLIGQPTKLLGSRGYIPVEELEPELLSGRESTPMITSPEDITLLESPHPQIITAQQTGLPLAWNNLHESISEAAILFRDPVSKFCLTTFFFKRVAFASEGFMFQYASEKFLWQLRQTTWLRVAQASGAITSTLIVCPFLASFLPKQGIAAHVVDLNVIRSALLMLTVSFFLSWKASSGLFLAFCMELSCPLLELNPG